MNAREKSPLLEFHSWRYRFKVFRKKCYSCLPYIKRRKYRQKYEELRTAKKLMFNINAMLSSRAVCDPLFPLRKKISSELCLFVTYAPSNSLKPHVVGHVLALLDEGIDVVLIINSDLKSSDFAIPLSLISRLRGVYFRENKGFDFGAWAQVAQLVHDFNDLDRMYWINDSIVGPFDIASYNELISKVKTIRSDLVGLTENFFPQYHLQSFFLVFNRRLLKDDIFFSFISSVLNLPTKQNVIDFYETELTGFITEYKFSCECLFQNRNYKDSFKDETTRAWQSLIKRGFPFIKASVLAEGHHIDDIKRLLQKNYIP